jgi:hypothetical protein
VLRSRSQLLLRSGGTRLHAAPALDNTCDVMQRSVRLRHRGRCRPPRRALPRPPRATPAPSPGSRVADRPRAVRRPVESALSIRLALMITRMDGWFSPDRSAALGRDRCHECRITGGHPTPARKPPSARQPYAPTAVSPGLIGRRCWDGGQSQLYLDRWHIEGLT